LWDEISSVIKPCHLQFPTVKEVHSSCIQMEGKGVHISEITEEPLRIEIRMHMATGCLSERTGQLSKVPSAPSVSVFGLALASDSRVSAIDVASIQSSRYDGLFWMHFIILNPFISLH